MDNWLFLLLGLILGIPFSIFANFVTPWIKSYWNKRYLSIRERRIYLLLTRYRYIKEISKNPFMIQFGMYRLFALALAIIGMVIFMLGMFIFLAIVFPEINLKSNDGVFYMETLFIFTLFFMFGYVIEQITDTIDDMMRFNIYRERVRRKLKKLGGNPEDLDKEEAA